MSLQEQYKNEIVPQLKQELGEKNAHAVPRLVKIVVNVGTGKVQDDPKLPEVVQASLEAITGQRAVRTLARKSIAGFKIREEMPIGTKVTVRGVRMWALLERIIHIALPRVRDFRGLPHTVVDAQGNISIGLKEQVVFPEIDADAVEKLHGLQFTIVTTAGTRERGLAFFRALGVPLQKPTGKRVGAPAATTVEG
jgi:large subunit ribosomal protein L5